MSRNSQSNATSNSSARLHRFYPGTQGGNPAINFEGAEDSGVWFDNATKTLNVRINGVDVASFSGGFNPAIKNITPAAQAGGRAGAILNAQMAFGNYYIVGGGAEADGVALPAATGSMNWVDVCCDSGLPISVFTTESDGQFNQFGAGIAYEQMPRTRIRYKDTGVGRWDFDTNLPFIYPIYYWTARAGGGQALATQTGFGINVAQVCATDLDSFKLPTAYGGCNMIVYYNPTAKQLALWPKSGGKINAQAIDTPVYVGPGQLAIAVDIGPPNQWVVYVAGQGYVLPVTVLGTFNPADATTYFAGNGNQTFTTTEQIQRIRIPRGSRIRQIDLSFINQGVGSAETSSISLRKNAATDYLLSAAVNNSAVYQEINSGFLDIPVQPGDFFEIKWVTPTWVTNPTFVTMAANVYVE